MNDLIRPIIVPSHGSAVAAHYEQSACTAVSIVGFFDILGFSQLADVDTDDKLARAARLIKQQLVEIPQDAAKELDVWPPLFNKQLNWCIFSDTILLWYDIPPNEPEVYYWYYFFGVCARLMTQTFNAGLPLRGAISTGKIWVDDHCFVGKPIIECYKLANRTDWAGCVLTRAAKSRLKQLWSNPESISIRICMEQVCLRYKVPMKSPRTVKEHNSKGRSQMVIKWFHDDRRAAPADMAPAIPGVARKSFKAHGKRLTKDAKRKLKHTTEFLVFVDSLYANANRPRKKLKRGQTPPSRIPDSQ